MVLRAVGWAVPRQLTRDTRVGLGCALKWIVSANLHQSRSEQDTVYCLAWQRVFGAGRFSDRRESVLSCVCLLSLFLQQPQAAWKTGEPTAPAVEDVAHGGALPKGGVTSSLWPKRGWSHH